MWLLSKSNNKVSSRKQMQIKEVKDGILVLPGNKYRLAIETSSINFELKSEEEQDVLIDSFQNFLNSLPCELQILVRVREVDVNRYLEQVSETLHNEREKVYKDQIENYCDFIKDLVAGSKILSRHFYIVIPYQADKAHDFTVIKEQIVMTRDIVLRGLEKLGMKAKTLDTLELLTLFYSFYNPNQARTQELRTRAIQELSHA